MIRVDPEIMVSHLKPQVNLEEKRFSHGSRVKSQEERHEPGLSEFGVTEFLSCLRTSTSDQ